MSKVLKIYGFHGSSGSGKDYLGSVLSKMLNPVRRCKFVSLADQLKIFSMVEDRLSFDRVFVNKDAESRRSLQLRGTELGRNVHGSDYWVRYMLAWMRKLKFEGFDTVFITDIRFPEEYDTLRGLPQSEDFKGCEVKIFKVVAPKRTYDRRYKETNGDLEKIQLISNHLSETALNHLPDEAFDEILYNDPGENSLDVLREIALVENAANQEEHVLFLDLDDTICECGIYYEGLKNRVSDLLEERLIKFIKPDAFIDPELDKISALFEAEFNKYRANHETQEFTRFTFSDALVHTAKVVINNIIFDENFDFPTPNLEFKFLFEEIREIGNSVHKSPFDALPGTLETVNWLRQLSQVKLVIVTVGERPDQIRKLARFGLADVDCETTMLKCPNAYRQWMLKYPAKNYTMIGDSYSRDIGPAIDAGINTVIQICKMSSPLLANQDGMRHGKAKNLEEAIGMLFSTS